MADPCWVVDEIRREVARGALAIMGNHDHAVLASSERMNPTAQAAIEWTRRQLNDEHRGFLASLSLAIEENGRLFVHASACEPAAWDYVISAREASRSFTATGCHQTFCGHVHVPAIFYVGRKGKVGAFTPVPDVHVPLLANRKWLAVIGSVGQPRDDDPAACYALLDDHRNVLTYLRVPYDTATAACKVRAAGLPAILAERLETGS